MDFAETPQLSTTAAQGGATVVIAVSLHQIFAEMLPYLILAAVVIFVDLIFGLRAAAHRKEEVRLSRAIRRTISKMFEYVCWVTLSATLATTFRAAWFEWLILGVVLGNEIISIMSNWFAVHGYKVKGLNIFRLVGHKTGLPLDDVTIEREE